MKTILLTGGSGFIGKNILPILRQFYEVQAPTRAELNTIDEKNVNQFFQEKHFNAVIHCANISPAKNPLDSQENMLEYTLRAYFNLENQSEHYEKLFYFGSGAECDKRFDICQIKEEQIGKSIPTDDYGFAKYIINKAIQQSEKSINLRIFGCYGKEDAKTKFIRDTIDCCLEKRAITIRQNCLFDYIFVEDIAKILCLMIENKTKYKDYNIATSSPISLKKIAEIIAKEMGNSQEIQILKQGWNKEYTANNSRFKAEFSDFRFTTIQEGIAKQIAWQRSL